MVTLKIFSGVSGAPYRRSKFNDFRFEVSPIKNVFVSRFFPLPSPPPLFLSLSSANGEHQTFEKSIFPDAKISLLPLEQFIISSFPQAFALAVNFYFSLTLPLSSFFLQSISQNAGSRGACEFQYYSNACEIACYRFRII